MSKKSDKYRLQQPRPQQAKGQRAQAAKPKQAEIIKPELALGKDDPAMKFGLLLIVLIATFFCYKYTLKNQFTNWDDGLYVETNPYIKNLTWDNMKMILLHNITNNYYHPITMLTIAWNYYTSKMDPGAYYLTNVVIHVMGTAAMFFLFIAIFNTMAKRGYAEVKGKLWLAAFGALFYGVHPMHVESVSWLAERKDVLYSLFYSLGMIAYINYCSHKDFKWAALVILLYGCSMLSKPLAVVFPFSLMAIDILFRRDKESEKLLWDIVAFGALLILALGVMVGVVKANLIRKPVVDAIVMIGLFATWGLTVYKFNQKKFSTVLLEKVPFFLVSLAAGIWAWQAQKASGAVASFNTFSIAQRFMFATFGLTMYFIKAFVPFHLCSYYPYPNIDNRQLLDWHFYIKPMSVIAAPTVVIIAAFVFAKKYLRAILFGAGFLLFSVALFFLLLYYPGDKDKIISWYFYVAPICALAALTLPVLITYLFFKEYLRPVIFGLSFFFVNLMFVLQFVSSGPAILADRYCYVAYLGLFFIVVYGVGLLIDKWESLKIPLQLILLGFAVYLAVGCYNRTKVWHNTKTLWQDVIKKYPGRVQTSYKNLGNFYADLGPTNFAYYDSAYTNYVTLVKIHLADAGTYSNIANIYGLRKQYDSALISYDIALQMDPKNFDAHLDRAITYSLMKKYDKAIQDYNTAASMDPLSEKLLENRASTYLYAAQYAKAIADYTQLLKINPDRQMTYLDRGAAEWDLADYKNALTDLTYYHKLDPHNGQCLFDLAVTYEKLKDFKNAYMYAQMARDVQFKVEDPYMNYLKQQAGK